MTSIRPCDELPYGLVASPPTMMDGSRSHASRNKPVTALVSPVRLSGLSNEKETNMLCFYSTFLKII